MLNLGRIILFYLSHEGQLSTELSPKRLIAGTYPKTDQKNPSSVIPSKRHKMHIAKTPIHKDIFIVARQTLHKRIKKHENKQCYIELPWKPMLFNIQILKLPPNLAQ